MASKKLRPPRRPSPYNHRQMLWLAAVDAVPWPTFSPSSRPGMSGEKMPGLSEGTIVMLHLASRSTMSVLRIYLVPDVANGGVDPIGTFKPSFKLPAETPDMVTPELYVFLHVPPYRASKTLCDGRVALGVSWIIDRDVSSLLARLT